MEYQIVEFEGDYPLAYQENWGAKFESLENAEVAAREVFDAKEDKTDDYEVSVVNPDTGEVFFWANKDGDHR